MTALIWKKLECYANVILSNTDAYTLEGVDGTFETAFAADWWSHIPYARISAFLHNLHQKLVAGSRVTFVDMSYRDDFNNDPTHFDSDGNRISKRTLPDGSEFEVVKNFPSERELY